MRRTARQQAGFRAQATGARFEGWIEMQHERAAHLGILAHVEHNQPHAKNVGGRLIYTRPGVADYTGTLEGGRSLAVEAKSRMGRLLRSDIEPRQAIHLEAVSRAGGLALLLVEFRDEHKTHRFAIPWLEVPWETLRSAESIGFESMRAEWLALSNPESCYLLRFHSGGAQSWGGRGVLQKRVFARE